MVRSRYNDVYGFDTIQREAGGAMKRLALILALASLVAVHGQGKVVRIATLPEFPPFCFLKPGGAMVDGERVPHGHDSVNLQGYAWDLVRESYHARGYTIVLSVRPWSWCLSMLDRGLVDLVFPAEVTDERLERYAYSSETVDSMGLTVYVPADRVLSESAYQNLRGLRVGYLSAWSYGDALALYPDVVLVPLFEDIRSAFDLLDSRRRFDALAGYDIPFDYVLRLMGAYDDYDRVRIPWNIVDYLMGLKGDGHAAGLLAEFDAGKRAIAASGLLRVLEGKRY